MSKLNQIYTTSTLLAGTGIIILVLQMTQPFFAIFLTKHTNLGLANIGYLIGLSSLIGTLSAILGGQISDIIGHKRIILLSILLTSIVLILFYFVSILALPNLFLIFAYALLNILLSVFTVSFIPSSQAVISQFLPDTKHNLFFQLRYTVATVAYSLGPIVVSVWSIIATPQAFLASGIICFAYLIFLLSAFRKVKFKPYDPYEENLNFKKISGILAQDHRIIYLAIIGIIFYFSQSLFVVPFSLFLTKDFNHGLEIFTILLIINPVIVFICQPIIYWLAKNKKLVHVLMLGLTVNAAAFFLLGFAAHHVTLVIAAWIISSIAETMIYPYVNSLINAMAPPALRGSYFGFANLAILGLSIGPLVGGKMIEIHHLDYLFLATGCLSLLACVLCRKIQTKA